LRASESYGLFRWPRLFLLSVRCVNTKRWFVGLPFGQTPIRPKPNCGAGVDAAGADGHRAPQPGRALRGLVRR